jgi:hypothetical protein
VQGEGTPWDNAVCTPAIGCICAQPVRVSALLLRRSAAGTMCPAPDTHSARCKCLFSVADFTRPRSLAQHGYSIHESSAANVADLNQVFADVHDFFEGPRSTGDGLLLQLGFGSVDSSQGCTALCVLGLGENEDLAAECGAQAAVSTSIGRACDRPIWLECSHAMHGSASTLKRNVVHTY